MPENTPLNDPLPRPESDAAPDSPPNPGESPPDGYAPEITRSPVTAVVLGLIAGAASGLLGIGGGMVIGPGLTRALRIRPARANGTSLAVMVLAALIAASRYQLEAGYRNLPGISPWVVVMLTAGGFIGALGGALLGASPLARRLKPYFGLPVVAIGAAMLWAPHSGLLPPDARPGSMLTPAAGFWLVLVGAVANVFAGYLSLGGGLLLIPALAILLGYPQTAAQATSLAVIVPACAGGALLHLARGNIVRPLALPLAIGTAAGAWFLPGLAWWINDALAENALRTVFGVVLAGMGGMLFLRGLRTPSPARRVAAARRAD